MQLTNTQTTITFTQRNVQIRLYADYLTHKNP